MRNSGKTSKGLPYAACIESLSAGGILLTQNSHSKYHETATITTPKHNILCLAQYTVCISCVFYVGISVNKLTLCTELVGCVQEEACEAAE